MGKTTIEQLAKEEGLVGDKKNRIRKKPNIKVMPVKEKDKELAALRRETEGQTKVIEDLQKKVPAGARPMEHFPPSAFGDFMERVHMTLAARFGEHWLLTKKEKEDYGTAIHAVANRYFNVEDSQYKELIILATVMVGVNLDRGIITWVMTKQ